MKYSYLIYKLKGFNMDILKKNSLLLATIILFSLTSPTFAMNYEEELSAVEFHPNGRIKLQESKIGEHTTVTKFHKNGKLKSIADCFRTEYFNKDGKKTHVTDPSGDLLLVLNPEGQIIGGAAFIDHEEEEALGPSPSFVADNKILTTYPNGQVKEGTTEEGYIIAFNEDGSIEALKSRIPSNF